MRQLKTYLKLTDWFREYIEDYATKSKSLQERKTNLLKKAFLFERARKTFTSKTRLFSSIFNKIEFFRILQKHFSSFFFLNYFNHTRQLYIDFDASKKNEINAMIYHVSSTVSHEEYSQRTKIQSILFLSRLLSSARIRYWSTELKIVELVWVLRKIRYLIESFKLSTIVYIDHEVSVEIVKQTSLSTSFIDKLNLRLIRASEYIQRFLLNIRHKSKKLHVVSDVFFRFVTSNKSSSNDDEDEFDILFTVFMIEMNSNFKIRMIDEYKKNFVYVKIFNMFSKDNDKLSFLIEDSILYRKKISDDCSSFALKRMCVSDFMIKNILTIIHDEFNEHTEFDRTYERITNSWYIRELSKQLTEYLKHCFKCQINRIRRHKFYDSLQSILSSLISFHTFTIDFVLVLSISHTDMNNVMTITNKFSKRVIIVLDKNIWIAAIWVKALLDKFDLTNWNLFKIIISNRNRKFLSNLWSTLFSQLNVKLLYSTVYHSQIDDASKRTNQIIEIALRYHIQALNDCRDWSTIVEIMQRTINNSTSSTEKSSNEICYEFTSINSTNLLKTFNSVVKSSSTKLEIVDSIAMTQISSKKLYDQKHQSLTLNIEDWALLRLHKDYQILSSITLNFKLSQQYVSLFEILEKIENLAYRLKISEHWRIWFVVSIAQLESFSALNDDSFNRTKASLSFVIMKEKFSENTVRSYEIEKMLAKRINRRKSAEYLIRWFDYDLEKDAWRNLSKLQNAMNLVRNFDAQVSSATSTSKRERLKKQSIIK